MKNGKQKLIAAALGGAVVAAGAGGALWFAPNSASAGDEPAEIEVQYAEAKTEAAKSGSSWKFIEGRVDLLDQEVLPVGPEDAGTHSLWTTRFDTEFSGGLTGNGWHIYVDTYSPDGSARSVGGATFVGAVESAAGSFIMDSVGTANPDGDVDAIWCINSESATEELEGIVGCGEVKSTGQPYAEYTLYYRMGS